MAKMDTNYPIRIPSNEEMIRAFGSLGDAFRITDGDLPLILFLLNNPCKISTYSLPQGSKPIRYKAFRDNLMRDMTKESA